MSKHLAACLYKEHQEEVLNIFSEEYHTLKKSTNYTSEGKTLCATEEMAQDIMHEQPFSLLELPDYFSSSSKNQPLLDDEESMHLDDTSLLTSKTTDLLNYK